MPDTPHHLNVDVQPFSKELDYDSNGNVIYFGEAMGGTATSAPFWRIRHLSYDANGNLLSALWAGGSNTFVNAWDNRAALSYS